MRLLDRYLLREFLIPLGFCLGGFLILWVAFDLFSELHSMQEKQLLARDIAEHYVYKIPEFLILVLPISLLLSLLYALTNHARFNEITAIRAAGVSLWRLSLPYLAIGFLATAALFALNEFGVPKTSEVAEEILRRRVTRQTAPDERHKIRNLGFINSRAGQNRKWQIGVYDTRAFEMIQPVVNWPSNGAPLTLYAERAVWTNGGWTFTGKVVIHGVVNGQFRQLLSTNYLPMPQFTERPEEIQSEININAGLNNQRRTLRANVPLVEIARYLSLHPNPDRSIRPWLYTKLHGRFAGPCVCLVVVLIAVPFAAASGRRNVFVAVASSIFIFFAYFLLQQLGFAFGEKGRIEPWLAAWLPNMVFAAAGIWMLTRVR